MGEVLRGDIARPLFPPLIEENPGERTAWQHARVAGLGGSDADLRAPSLGAGYRVGEFLQSNCLSFPTPKL